MSPTAGSKVPGPGFDLFLFLEDFALSLRLGIEFEPIEYSTLGFFGWLWVGVVWFVLLVICLSQETLTFWRGRYTSLLG